MTEREKEFEKVKKILKENIREARCGIFFSKNDVGDPMLNLYIGKNFTVEICRTWDYYEVFGCNIKEERELINYYEKIKKEDFELEEKECGSNEEEE